jgi:cobalt-zinc-cadmium efflux system protein
MLSTNKCRDCECTSNPTKLGSHRQKTRLLWTTVVMLAGFFAVEWSVGLWTHSLSLQADAGHILSDVAALGISLVATCLAQKPPSGKATFGHSRVEILAALANSLILLAIAVFIASEAINRFQSPETILGLPMLAVAMLGLVINLLNITLLHSHSHNDLNIKGALLHVIADTGSSVGVLLAAVAIHFWDWFWADAAISFVVAIFIAFSALPLLKESLNILLEYAPSSIAPATVEAALKSFPGVVEVEKLYIWTINADNVMLSAHLVVESATIDERERMLRNLQVYLRQNFGINETTLQLTNRKFKPVIPIHPLFNQSLVSMLPSTKAVSQLAEKNIKM